MLFRSLLADGGDRAAVAGQGGPEGVVAKKAKTKGLSRCYRCDEPGHHGKDCVVEVCDVCESKEHVSDCCPLLDAPKPQVMMHGFITEGLTFFEQPLSNSYKPKIDNVRLAMVTVTGGDLSVPQVVRQLQRLVPMEFTWDVNQVGHNVFKVPFPSRSELDRLAIFGACRVPNSSCEITVTPWTSMVEPCMLLPKKWIRISGIPYKFIGDYLAMWSLGSLFGKTFKVDMKFTRKYGVLRILVGCVDYSLIPAAWTVFIKDGFYRLRFKVENPVDASDVEEDPPLSPPPDDDASDKGSKNLDKRSEERRVGKECLL